MKKEFKRAELFGLILLSFFIYSLAAFLEIPWLIFAALVHFFYALNKATTYKTAFSVGYVFGLLYFSLTFGWLVNVSKILFVLIVLIEAIYLGLFGLFCRRIYKRHTSIYMRSWWMSAAWVTLEWVRSLGFFGMPAGLLGYFLAPYLTIVQIASATSVYGISFVVILGNCLVFYFFREPRARQDLIMFGLIVFLGLFAHGRYAIYAVHPPAKSARLTIIQGNIPPSAKRDAAQLEKITETHIQLTQNALQNAPQKPDLIVWPETAFPGFLFHPQRAELLQKIQTSVKNSGIPLLLGTQHMTIDDSGKHAYNMAVLFGSDGEILDDYSKINLVPLAEKSPTPELIPYLRGLGLGSVYESGGKWTVFNIDGRRFSVVICYESLFPDLVRQFVRGGAEFIINITNDQPSLGAMPFYYEQNARMTIFRAIETRRCIVRVANNGISMVIDPWGRVTGQIPAFTSGFLQTEVLLSRMPGLFNRSGLWFPMVCLGFSSLGIVAKSRTKKS